MSCRRDDVLTPEVFVLPFVSPDGLVDAFEEVKLFCADIALCVSLRHVSSFDSQL